MVVPAAAAAATSSCCLPPQLLVLALLVGAGARSASTSSSWAGARSSKAPQYTSRWQGSTHGLPRDNLPDLPLIGNGHIGALLDTTSSGDTAGYTSRAFGIRQSTSCSSYLAHSGVLCMGCALSQCEKACATDRRCAVFSYGGAGACYNSAQSCCFAEKDTSQCAPGVSNWTSGVRAPNPPARVPSGGANVSINLRIGSNAMWALVNCSTAGNASASAPFGPQWQPPMSTGCSKAMAVGGLRIRLFVGSGVLNVTSQQQFSSPEVTGRVSIGRALALTVTSFIHPTQNLLVTQITNHLPEGRLVLLSNYALSSGDAPSTASLSHHGMVGTVTRKAVTDEAVPPGTRQVVVALSSSSVAVASWQLAAPVQHEVAVQAELSLRANETAEVFTSFADNALNGVNTGAAPGVTAAASVSV
eukprot:SAG25_NODE_1_length_41698_cov_149.842015_34_plen_416_part_00